MRTFGEQTRPTIFLTIESHKLHKEFDVPSGTPVRYGQPVKLNAQGQAVPLAAGDNKNLMIGVSMHDSQRNIYGPPQKITVIMRGYTTILCRAGNAAVNAGPVQLQSYTSIVGPADEDAKYEAWYGLNIVEQAAATDADILGWAIEPAAANGDVEVVIF